MYLCSLDFCYRRYFSGTGCIFIYLPAPIEDTFFHAHVSPISLSLSLQILLNHLTMYNCIFITRKSIIADTHYQQMASSLPGKSPSQMLAISKWHLHCPRNHHCRYFSTTNQMPEHCYHIILVSHTYIIFHFILLNFKNRYRKKPL